MSGSGSDREWAFIDDKGNEESHSDDSGSSSDFIHVDSETVSYHHKGGIPSQPSDDLEHLTLTSTSAGGVPSAQVGTSEGEQSPTVEGEKPELQASDTESPQLKPGKQDSDISFPELIDSLDGLPRDDSEGSELGILDAEVVSALTCPGSLEMTASKMSSAGLYPDESDPDDVIPQPSPADVALSDNTDSPDGGQHSEVQSFEEELTAADVSDGNDSADDVVQEMAENASQSSSGIEELVMPEEGEGERMMQSSQNSQVMVKLSLPSVDMLKKEEKASKSSDSESDLSDIVRIEQNSPEDGSRSQRGYHQYVRAADLMQVSASSSSSGTSSLSSQFHFVHSLPRKYHYVYPRDEEEDVQSLPDDVDDRCESDISGVVPDDSDPDLSSISYSLDQLEIMEGNVVRSYKHRPNSRLNTLLSILALLTLFTTIGVGIGHYLGTQRELLLRSQQGVRIKEIQDEYLRCLHNQDLLEAQVSITDAEKIAAVTAVWKQKYEELIIEKVELEHTMKQLEKNMENDLHEARSKLLANQAEALLVANDVNLLHQEYHPNVDNRNKHSKHDRHTTISQSGLKKKQAWKAGKEERLAGRALELDRRELELKEMETMLKQRELDLSEKEAFLNQHRTSLLLRATSLARAKVKIVQREKLLVANLGGHEQKLKEDQAKLQEDQAKLEEDQAKLQEDQAKLEEEQDKLQEDQVKLLEEQAKLQDKLAKVQEVQAKLEEEQVRVHEEWTMLQKNQDRIQEQQAVVQEGQANLREEQVKLLREQVRLEEQASKHDKEMVLLKQFRNLQEQTNLLRLENDDLRHQVARLRYSTHHPEAKKDKVDDLELKKLINNLVHEKMDLVSAIGSMRYKQPLSAEHEGADDKQCKSVDETENPKNMMKTEPPLSSDQVQKDSPDQSQLESDWISIMWVYFSQLVPDVSLSDLHQTVSTSKAATHIGLQFQFIENITKNNEFRDAVTQKVNRLRALVESFISVKEIDNKVHAVIADLKNMFETKLVSFQEYLSSEEVNKMKDKARRKVDTVADSPLNSAPATKYEEFLNKTKESVSQLSNKIKHTWNKMKNITGNFLKKNKGLKNLGDSISKSIEHVGKTVDDKWKKANRHLKKGLLTKSWNWFGNKRRRNKNTAKSNDPNKKGSADERAERADFVGHPHYHDHLGHESLEVKQYKKNLGYQKKQSSNVDYEKYEEYWQQAEFEPDDFLQEGFFEGNNRQWHKHQKRARKLHGRLQRLTDDIFLAMDDDDIEDMYEDFEDLQEDIDSQDPPERLMTWLTCQVRWWKSRLYRKHSNEDLVKGCGRQLMQWQLRALCKPCGSSSKQCRKRQRGVSEGPFCHYYQTVILPSKKQGPQGAESKPTCGRDQSSQQFLTFSIDLDTPRLDGQLETKYGRLRYSLSLNDEDDDDGPQSAVTMNSTDDGTGQERSAKWMFERAEDREAFHHNGLWVFKRGASREFERNKPWYYERADRRADKRGMPNIGQHHPDNQ